MSTRSVIRDAATRVFLAAFRLAGRLPLGVRLRVGTGLGVVLRQTMRRRRAIAAANIEHCFAAYAPAWRERVLRGQFRELGIAVLETAAAWSLPGERLDPLLEFKGLEHLTGALEGGHGVIVVAAHTAALEMAMQLLARRQHVNAIYRRNKNPVLDRAIYTVP